MHDEARRAQTHNLRTHLSMTRCAGWRRCACLWSLCGQDRYLANDVAGSLTCTYVVPPAGFEPATPPPEGGVLSPELRGLGQAEVSSVRAMIIGVEVVPVASPMWPVPGVSSS